MIILNDKRGSIYVLYLFVFIGILLAISFINSSVKIAPQGL